MNETNTLYGILTKFILGIPQLSVRIIDAKIYLHRFVDRMPL